MSDKKTTVIIAFSCIISIFFGITCPYIILKIVLFAMAAFLGFILWLFIKPNKNLKNKLKSADATSSAENRSNKQSEIVSPQRETSEELRESFIKEIEERTVDHDYERLYHSAEEASHKLSDFFGQTMNCKDFLESIGYALLSQEKLEAAYAVFRAGAEYCNSRVAQFNLGNMFANGHGVTNNLGAAYYWFYKASQNTVGNGAVACDTILRHVAENGNPISNILYGEKDTALPGYRRAMNIQMFISSLASLCERGCDMFPSDPNMATYLKEQCGNLMEQYK